MIWGQDVELVGGVQPIRAQFQSFVEEIVEEMKWRSRQTVHASVRHGVFLKITLEL
jgi:hypothetical protein